MWGNTNRERRPTVGHISKIILKWRLPIVGVKIVLPEATYTIAPKKKSVDQVKILIFRINESLVLSIVCKRAINCIGVILLFLKKHIKKWMQNTQPCWKIDLHLLRSWPGYVTLTLMLLFSYFDTVLWIGYSFCITTRDCIHSYLVGWLGFPGER